MDEQKLFFEDFHIGRSFPLGPRSVAADEIIDFAREFDPQPMHVDEEAGHASILGGLAASGWHTSSIFMRMLIDSFLLASHSEGSPGIDVMDWKKPVLAGDTLFGHTTVIEGRPLRSRPGVGLVLLRHEVCNQRGELVCFSENPIMFRMRDRVEAPR
jgi:acyl dehydratase